MTQATIPEARHEHPEHLAHHFESLQQQYDSGKFGIWLFLTTEILMFSGLFCGYAVLRALHPEIFLYAAPLPIRAVGRTEYGGPDLQQLYDGLGRPRGATRPDETAGPPADDHAGLRLHLPGREVRRVQEQVGRGPPARQAL